MSSTQTHTAKIVTIGLAMFSMFFGSGNIVFPVLIGQATQDHAGYAFLGLIVTAVLVPFVGLYTLSLYEGRYVDFFGRLGRRPGWIIVVMIMGLVGPFAVIPRCIAIAHASFATFFPDLSVAIFSAISCVVIYGCTYKRSRILDILGRYLTPVLLLSLVTIIAKGLLTGASPAEAVNAYSPLEAVGLGLSEGYNTMDLFAAFLFSGVILTGIRSAFGHLHQPRALLVTYLKASCIGMSLLAAVYWGMCAVAARHGGGLELVAKDRLLGELTLRILGPYAGLVVCLAVTFACLTTAISLALVFTEFVTEEISRNKWNYRRTLVATLAISFLVSTLEFEGIQKFLVPLLQLILPALMVLTLANLLHKIYGIKAVRLPVAVTFALTLAYRLWV